MATMATKAQIKTLYGNPSGHVNQPINQPEPDDAIDEILDDIDLGNKPLAPVIYNNTETPQVVDVTNMQNDIDYSRRTLQSLIEKSQQLVEMALDNAADGSQPRNIEVASGAISTCADMADRLVNLHEKLQKITGSHNDAGTGNTFVNNNNKIILTSSELLKQIIDENNTNGSEIIDHKE